MADKMAELLVDVTARIDKLEAGLKKAEAKVQQSAKNMDKSMSKGPAAGMAKLAVGAAKVAVALEAIKLTMVGFQAAVAGTTAAFGLLSGDSEKFFKSMEKLDDQITKIPILGSMLSSTADEIVAALALFSPTIQKLEEMEKVEAKRRKGRATMAAVSEMAKTNKLLQKQIEMTKELDDFKRESLKFDLQRARLAHEHEKTVHRLVKEVGRNSAEGKAGVKRAEEQLALQLQLVDAEEQRSRALRQAAEEEARIAELKAIEEERQQKSNQAQEMLGNARARIEVLELEEQIVIQTNEEEKRKLELQKELLILKQQQQEQEEAIRAAGFSAEDQEKLLKLLDNEHGRLRMIAREKHRIAEAERKAAEEAERHNEALQKQMENQKKLLQEQLDAAEKRKDEINSRLGMASKEAGAKSGFTQSGSTAMGTFTFAEKGAQDAIRDLAKENLTVQKTIDQTLKSIETLTRKLAEKVGFK